MFRLHARSLLHAVDTGDGSDTSVPLTLNNDVPHVETALGMPVLWSFFSTTCATMPPRRRDCSLRICRQLALARHTRGSDGYRSLLDAAHQARSGKLTRWSR
jgi:hypothetical protein